MKVYIGMEVHCKSTVFVAQGEGGKVIAQGKIPVTKVSICTDVGANGGTFRHPNRSGSHKQRGGPGLQRPMDGGEGF